MIDSLNVEISCLKQAVNAKDSLLNIKLESRDSALQAISYKKKIKPETIRDTIILYKEIIKDIRKGVFFILVNYGKIKTICLGE